VSAFQAIVLALLQGVTELFPVSSLGHSVVIPALLGWGIDKSSPTFLAFLTLLHVGTATALVVYFRREWWAIARALLRSSVQGRLRGDPEERLGWMLVMGTIPLGLAGIFFESTVRSFFGNPRLAAVFLVVNGAVMYAGERARRRALAFDDGRTDLSRLSLLQAVGIGASQILAFLPGISRSGSSITAGLVAGLRHASAARFSFLLATPAIGAAGLLEIPRLFDSAARPYLGLFLFAAVLSGVAAYLSVAYLMRYFRGGRLDPFAVYCAGLGLAAFVILTVLHR
jgi:undecaprenyl-diphosphatase